MAHGRAFEGVALSELVAITGASGFVGSALVADLLARGIRVRALVRDASRAPEGAEVVVIRRFDDAIALARALDGAGAVVHLAARAHVMRETVSNIEAAYQAVNVDGTRHLLGAVRAARVPRFVFVSSVKAVGEWSTAPFTEEMPPAPEDAYGRTKLAAEELVREAQREGLHAPILRLPLVYGPGVKGNLWRLLGAISRGWPMPFAGVPNRRSLAALENVVAAIDSVLEAPAAASGTYFVSDDHDVSSAQLCEALAEGIGRSVRLVPAPVGLLHLAGRLGDLLQSFSLPAPLRTEQVRRLLGSLQVSPARLRAETGWAPVVDPPSALAATGRWFRSHAR